MFAKPKFWVVFAALAAGAFLFYQFWHWEVERVEVPTGKFLVKFRNLRDGDGRVFGHLDRFGNLKDSDGHVKGFVDKYGNLKDSDGRIRGSFDRFGNFRA